MKSRFSPSPTGYIHLGNARTALFNYLAAMAAKGQFLLRIEDTDQERSEAMFVDALKTDLQWLGMRWQEGPDVGGEHAPYFQSERLNVYDTYYQQLQDQGIAYPCFCSEEQLALSRKIQRTQGQAPRYPGTCRHLTEAEIQEKMDQGLKPVLRFKVPADETIRFVDLVRGEQQFQSNDIGDFIIRRNNGVASFMFCNAVDDALMGVTLAMRGEDHLTNSPRQIMILNALGLTPPTYAHISLIVGQDGSPLSKRHGSKSIRELRELGFLPIAVVNYLSRLGHTYENPEFMSMEDLSAQFDCDHLGKAPAKFDETQLAHWQKLAVMRLSLPELEAWLSDVIDVVPADKRTLFLETVQPNILFPSDAAVWVTHLFEADDGFSDEAKTLIQQAGKTYFEALRSAIELHDTDYAAITSQLKTDLSVKGKSLFQPLRVALTGQLHGPELKSILSLLGKDLALSRVTHIINTEFTA